MKRMWLLLWLYRYINALLIRTYFEPDEYWQSLEVAHQVVFGYGWLTWEWRSISAIRSFLYPLQFVGLFKLLQLLGWDRSDKAIIYGPRLLSAALAATVDYLTYHLSYRLFNSRRTAEASLLCLLVNWYSLAYSTRTLSNNLETLLTLLICWFWPIETSSPFPIYRLFIGLLFCGVAVMNRPSALTHWILPSMTAFLAIPGCSGKFRFIGLLLVAAGMVIAFGVGVDYLFYHRIVFTWWNFLRVNVFERISDFYGVNTWHFHLSQGLPMLMGTMSPLIVLAVVAATDQCNSWILQFIIGSVVANSLLPHKEVRFILPTLPFLMMLAGQGYRLQAGFIRFRWLRRVLLAFILISNLGAAWYFTRVHQSGPLAVVNFLRSQCDLDDSAKPRHVYFATPCHSTPFYAYLHRNIPMSFVTCEPLVSGSSRHDNLTTATENAHAALDESDKFKADPLSFLAINLPSQTSHLVLFEGLLQRHPKVRDYLGSVGFTKPCFHTFNSHWSGGDQHRQGDLLVYCR